MFGGIQSDYYIAYEMKNFEQGKFCDEDLPIQHWFYVILGANIKRQNVICNQVLQPKNLFTIEK